MTLLTVAGRVLPDEEYHRQKKLLEMGLESLVAPQVVPPKRREAAAEPSSTLADAVYFEARKNGRLGTILGQVK